MRTIVKESDFQSQVVALAKRLNWRCYHTHDSRKSEKGFCDLVLVRDGRLIFAELKTDSGKLTPEQDEWLEALAACDAEVYEWHPAEWENEIVPVLTSSTRPNKFEYPEEKGK